jgi:hypothetical protein
MSQGVSPVRAGCESAASRFIACFETPLGHYLLEMTATAGLTLVGAPAAPEVTHL